jgi:hypothetical protein
VLVEENTMITSDLDGGVIEWDMENRNRRRMIRMFEMKTYI